MWSAPSRPQSVELFYSYAHEDECLRDELVKHLALLKRSGTIADWHDRKIKPGAEWASEIDSRLKSARIILLLISADFLNSEYCCGVEMCQALEQHECGQARVIPVVLRPCAWQDAPFAKLQVLPKDGLAAVLWPSLDEAFTQVAQEIRNVAMALANPVPPTSDGHNCLAQKNGAPYTNGRPQDQAITPPDTKPSDGPGVAIAVGLSNIDIHIEGDIQTFSREQQERVLRAIAELLGMSGSDIPVVGKRSGSVILTLQLTPEQAEKVLWAAKAGNLRHVGIFGAEVNPNALPVSVGFLEIRIEGSLESLKSNELNRLLRLIEDLRIMKPQPESEHKNPQPEPGY
jgi:hypothetical protein